MEAYFRLDRNGRFRHFFIPIICSGKKETKRQQMSVFLVFFETLDRATHFTVENQSLNIMNPFD